MASHGEEEGPRGLGQEPLPAVIAAANVMGLFPPPSQSLDLYAQDPRNYFTDADGTRQLIPDTRTYGTEPTNLGDTAAVRRYLANPNLAGYLPPGHPLAQSGFPPPQQQYLGNYHQMAPDEQQYHRSSHSSSSALVQMTPDDPYLMPLPTDFHIGRMASDDLADIFHGVDLSSTSPDLALLSARRLARTLRDYLASRLPLLPPKRRHILPPPLP